MTLKQVTSPPWNSKEMVWASRWSVALRAFYRQILSLTYSFFLWNFRPRLVRALLVCWYMAVAQRVQYQVYHPKGFRKQIGSAEQDTSGSSFCQEKGQDGPRGCILWPIEEPGCSRIGFRDWPIALLTSRLVGASVLCGWIMAARDSHVNSAHCTS